VKVNRCCTMSTCFLAWICVHNINISHINIDRNNIHQCLMLPHSSNNLQSFSLNNCKKREIRNLCHLIKYCVNVEEVTFSHSSFITVEVLSSISIHCTKLTGIHLDSLSNLDDVALTKLINECNYLTAITIKNCKYIDDTSAYPKETCVIMSLTRAPCFERP
jgi:hypothetical protein